MIPFVLVLLGVRLVLLPWYLELEYRTPGFPADPYGFTFEERLHFARLSSAYLTNDESLAFVADLRFPDGEQAPPPTCARMDDCTRLYNDRELEHFVDVKRLVGLVLTVFYALVGLLLVMGLWSWTGGWWAEYLTGLKWGGLVTLAIIGLIVVTVLLAFEPFFIFFHEVFFPPGTWTFPTSDTFIRLFPERFWRDTFITVGAVAGIGALLLALLPGKARQTARNLTES
jgi:integral membrane protein (TIGR01906 family)